MNVQINKDNTNVENISNQYNYFFIAGTPFVSSSECKEGKYYESVKDSLYYPPQYLDQVISVLEAEHSILIQGEQGSGKSVLAFHIAERMKEQGIIVAAYYLNLPSDWNAIKQWIQSVHCQEKWRSEGAHLWIIDNLHRIAGAVEDFPDPSVWGQDFCVCCTRDLNGLPDENETWFQPVLSGKQILKRSIDKKTFLKCCHALTGNGIGRHESDYLYQYIGGNLAMLRYVIKSGNLPKSLVDWRNDQFIDFNNVYINYFGFGAAGRITRDNLDDTLKMLFLSQIDFPIPFYLQLNVCRTVLKDLYFETSDKELEMEHATLAELLTACICSKSKLNDRNVFTECLHWTLSNLADSRLNEQERLRQINVFLRSLCCYKFILNQNQTLHEVVLYDKCFLIFLENNRSIISLSVWKMIMEIVEGDSDVDATFRDFAKSPMLLETMKLNSDYDFRFFQDRLSQDELEKVEMMVLNHAESVTKSILDSENEACLTNFMLSLSESAAIKFVEQLRSCDLVRILCCKHNSLAVFARCYSRLGMNAKNVLDAKISMDDYRNILSNSASITGFAYLMSVATDSLREELCGILEIQPKLAEILVNRTVAEGSSIGTLHLSLRELKNESAEVLEAFEKAIGVKGYERLLEAQGTIPVLVDLMRYSSVGMRKELSGMFVVCPNLAEILVDRTVEEGRSIGTLSLSLRELKRESAEVLEAFEKAIGVKGYERLLEAQGTIPVLVDLMRYSSVGMRKELSSMFAAHPDLASILVDRTVMEGKSIGTLSLSLRELKRESAEVLEAFERAIGVKGYERLLEAQGTIPILAHLIGYSSAGMRKELSGMFAARPDLAEILMDRTVMEGSSISTLHLSLRELKRESTEVLEAFERAIGVKGYERLLEAQGTIPVLVDLMRYSSVGMRKELSVMFAARPDLAEILVDRTVDKGRSIGTLDLSLRELKGESTEVLEAFERTIGVKGYERLLEAQGTIPVLANFMRRSSVGMQKELSSMFAARPDLAEILVDRTVDEGRSIGTLYLPLGELKNKSAEVLEVFERTIGVKGYERLLEAQGTIPILAHLVSHSSVGMQKELSGMFAARPDLAEILVDRTVDEGRPIGTLYLPLGELKNKSTEVLEVFERTIGVKGYERLLEAQGTIPILVSLIENSSSEMQKELTALLNGRPELIKILVKRTVKEGSSISKLDISLRALGKECGSGLSNLEIWIGVDGYFEMFSKCNANSITILRIMACSSISGFLVDKMYANLDVWNESKSYISKESHTILKDFDRDLLCARKRGIKKFWNFVKDMVSIEEWLAWMKQGATLEEAVFMLGNLPLSIAKNIADAWLKRNDEMMEGLRSVRLHRDTVRTYESKAVNRMIMKIDNYNRQLFVLVKKEYSTLLENE